MCGLFGALAPHSLSKKEQTFVKQLAIMSTFRGLDGTGCLVASARKRRTAIYAELVTPAELMYNVMDGVDNLGQKHPINLMMGHARAATVGAVTKDNLHPFQFDNLIGAHNGGVTKYSKSSKHLNPKDLSDSYFFFEDISKRGLDEVIKDMAWGAYALTIYDLAKNHLIFLRNEQRPLHFAQAKNGTIYWASERMFLTFAAYKGGHGDDLTKGDNTFFELPEDTVWTWDFNTAKWLEPRILKHEPKVCHHAWEDILPKAPETKRTGWYGRREEYLAQKREKHEPPSKETVIHLPQLPLPAQKTTTGDTPAVIGVTKIEEYLKFKRYRGYKGAFYGLATVLDLLMQGDAIYGNPAKITDDVYWFGPRDWVFAKDKQHSMLKECYDLTDDDFYLGRVIVDPVREKEDNKEVAVG